MPYPPAWQKPGRPARGYPGFRSINSIDSLHHVDPRCEWDQQRAACEVPENQTTPPPNPRARTPLEGETPQPSKTPLGFLRREAGAEDDQPQGYGRTSKAIEMCQSVLHMPYGAQD